MKAQSDRPEILDCPLKLTVTCFSLSQPWGWTSSSGAFSGCPANRELCGWLLNKQRCANTISHQSLTSRASICICIVVFGFSQHPHALELIKSGIFSQRLIAQKCLSSSGLLSISSNDSVIIDIYGSRASIKVFVLCVCIWLITHSKCFERSGRVETSPFTIYH